MFVCVRVTLGIIGILLDLLSLLSYFLVLPQQGGNEHFGRHCPTKTLPSCCDIPEGRLGNVPAFFLFHFEWREAKPRTSLTWLLLQTRTERRQPVASSVRGL